jgi:osmotically-inducible protein OsmY
MKNSSSLLLTLLLLGAVVPLSSVTGCAGTPTRESTGEYIDDSTITAKVKAALVADKLVSAFAVSVETYKGAVQLSGFVDTPAQKQAAETDAMGVQGVRSVENKITVKNS